MLSFFLQTSAAKAAADTLNLQKATEELVEKIATTPADQLLSDFADKAVSFGLKVLAAIVIYLVGAWIIRKIKKLVHNIFEKRNTEHSIASFVESLVSITLTVSNAAWSDSWSLTFTLNGKTVTTAADAGTTSKEITFTDTDINADGTYTITVA